MRQLQLRLKNCIQTILDLESCMDGENSDFFESDFVFLKSCLAKIETMDLIEEDVSALEGYTVEFLKELSPGISWKNLYNIIQ